MLVEWLRVAEVWVGADFLFGRNRSGNFSLLRTLGQQYGFRAEKIDPIRYKDFVVSSTRIRRLVAEGRVEEAGALLGRHYSIDGTVIGGARRGRDLGFPTANLSTANELLPPNGVYATFSSVAGIGVGMTSDYGPAQRLYILRGYIPDGRGLHWRDHYVGYREEVVIDDDLALYLTKELK